MMTYPLKKVILQADVYMVCLQHALSTENLEVMGLLIGDVCAHHQVALLKLLFNDNYNWSF
jgi:hypothetical protein